MAADVKIYTTRICPYCVAAKQLFKSLNVAFQEISLEGQDNLRLQLSQENKGWRTVPMIFINGNFYGGFTDVESLHRQGKLLPLLG